MTCQTCEDRGWVMRELEPDEWKRMTICMGMICPVCNGLEEPCPECGYPPGES